MRYAWERSHHLRRANEFNKGKVDAGEIFCFGEEFLKWRAREDYLRPSGRRRRLRRCFASLYSNLAKVLIHPERNSAIE